MANAADLRKLVATDVAEEIPKEKFGPVIMSPPFVFVDGTFNTRDLGLVPGSTLRPGFVFRSGLLAQLTDNGKAVIAGKLGIKRIFDIRSPEERTKAPDPEIPGVENTWIESSRPDSTVELTKFISGVGEAGYEEMYLEVIGIYQPTWKAILEHVRDRPQDPFLIHCTAGRDRTGVISGLLQTLAGTPSDAVSLDYLLSRVGTEPVRPMLLAFARAGTNAESNESPGFYNLCSLRDECWAAFGGGVEREYGGFRQFVTRALGFSDNDLARIQANLKAT